MYYLLNDIVQIEDSFLRVLIYLTKPGVITGLLIAMRYFNRPIVSLLSLISFKNCSVRVYYLREKSVAQKGIVDLLQNMLLTEAKDKEFLLTKISQVTNGGNVFNYSVHRKVNVGIL